MLFSVLYKNTQVLTRNLAKTALTKHEVLSGVLAINNIAGLVSKLGGLGRHAEIELAFRQLVEINFPRWTERTGHLSNYREEFGDTGQYFMDLRGLSPLCPHGNLSSQLARSLIFPQNDFNISVAITSSYDGRYLQFSLVCDVRHGFAHCGPKCYTTDSALTVPWIYLE